MSGSGSGAGGGERGVVLVVALLILAVLAAGTAATLWWTRSELWAAGRARSLVQARLSAEAAVHHAIALLAPGTGFAALRAANGGLARTGDAGPLPFAGGGWVDFPGPPFGYGVIIGGDPGPGAPGSGRLAGERVELIGHATAVRGATRSVRATVGRARLAYAPAALVAVGGAVSIDAAGPGSGPRGGPSVVVDARDAAPGEVACVGAGSASAAERASASGATLLGATPATVVLPIDVVAFAAESGLVEESPDVLADPVGSPTGSGARRVRGGTAPTLRGRGAVVVGGDLDLASGIDFDGVLLVAGALRLAGPPCRVSGLVWAAEVAFAADCAIRHDAAAVAAADTALRLPRRAVLLALADG